MSRSNHARKPCEDNLDEHAFYLPSSSHQQATCDKVTTSPESWYLAQLSLAGTAILHLVLIQSLQELSFPSA